MVITQVRFPRVFWFYPCGTPAKRTGAPHAMQLSSRTSITPMDETLWRTVCARYQLGTPTQSPRGVAGGMRHRLYQAGAAGGDYAVKLLDAHMLAEPGQRAHWERAELLARHMAQASLPAVCALDGPDGPLLTLQGKTLALYPWREGATLPPSPASPDAAQQIGRLLGRIHLLASREPDNTAVPGGAGDDGEWAVLTARAQAAGMVWADALAHALSDIVRWSRASRRALQRLGDYQIWTHRDLDQKNVLWSDASTPWLLDWEGAGPLSPALEVMGTALNWAGQAAGAPQAAPFSAFVRGYREAMPLAVETLQTASDAVPDKWLLWLKFSMQRSLERRQSAGDEYDMAGGAVAHSLATLYALDRQAPMRHVWCTQG